MHGEAARALRLSLILGVAAGCSSRTTELGRGSDLPGPVETASVGSGGVTDLDAGGRGAGGQGAGGRGAGGRAAMASDASRGGATSPSPLADASTADGTYCSLLTCTGDVKCQRFDLATATTCQVSQYAIGIQTLSVGCGLVVTFTGVGQTPEAAAPFQQLIFDLPTGELVGARVWRPLAGLDDGYATYDCLGSRPELRQGGFLMEWDGCPTAHRCVVCTSPSDSPTSLPTCTADDFSQLAHLAARSSMDAAVRDGGG